MVDSFPTSVQEIGMVGCNIGDRGGKAILKWAQNALQLRMICIEQNNFSAELKYKFEEFQKSRLTVMIVI